jgi:hypothetical protein
MLKLSVRVPSLVELGIILVEALMMINVFHYRVDQPIE